MLLALLLKNEILVLVASLLTGAGSPTTLQAELISLFFFFSFNCQTILAPIFFVNFSGMSGTNLHLLLF